MFGRKSNSNDIDSKMHVSRKEWLASSKELPLSEVLLTRDLSNIQEMDKFLSKNFFEINSISSLCNKLFSQNIDSIAFTPSLLESIITKDLILEIIRIVTLAIKELLCMKLAEDERNPSYQLFVGNKNLQIPTIIRKLTENIINYGTITRRKIKRGNTFIITVELSY